MWIVQLALRRPYTFIVLAIFILIAGVLSILRTPKDIFPDINIPVCAAIWNFTGMPAEEFSNRITSVYERILTTVVNDIEHIESTSYNGIGVVKIYLQPNASVPVAMAQLTAASQAVLKQLPPGETPPLILSFSASNVPVLRLGSERSQFFRAATQRSCLELSSGSIGDGSRRRRPLSLRRQAARGFDRYQ